jgi:hypothetical protein
MSTNPVNDPFAFVQDGPPPLLAAPRPRRSSTLRRLWIGIAFISLDLAILACVLHLLRIVAIPGLPAMDEATRPDEAGAPAARKVAGRKQAGSSLIAKVVRSRGPDPVNAPKVVAAAKESAAAAAPLEEIPSEKLSPEEVLEREGLKKAGAAYVFSDEQDLLKGLEKSRLSFKQAEAAFGQLKQAVRAFDEVNGDVQSGEAVETDLKANVGRQQELVNGLPRVTNVDKEIYYVENNRLSVLKSNLIDVRQKLEHRRRELPAVRHRSSQAIRGFRSRQTRFLSEARQLERAFDSRIEEYSSLAKEPKIKQSLAAISRASGQSLELRPSAELLKGREELKKQIETVENTAVPQM